MKTHARCVRPAPARYASRCTTLRAHHATAPCLTPCVRRWDCRCGREATPIVATSARAGEARGRDLASYGRQCMLGRMQEARRALLDALAGAPEAEWLALARALVLRSDIETAHFVLSAAAVAHPVSVDVRYALAGILQQQGEPAAAEVLLHALLAEDPAHAAATFLLAGLLSQQGRLHAAADTLCELFRHAAQDVDTVIRAVEMLDDIQRVTDAAAICENHIAAGCTEPRIHAYAGMLSNKLGQFERARKRYAFALAHSPQAVEWNIPIGLSSLQRYHHG